MSGNGNVPEKRQSVTQIVQQIMGSVRERSSVSSRMKRTQDVLDKFQARLQALVAWLNEEMLRIWAHGEVTQPARTSPTIVAQPPPTDSSTPPPTAG